MDITAIYTIKSDYLNKGNYRGSKNEAISIDVILTRKSDTIFIEIFDINGVVRQANCHF